MANLRCKKIRCNCCKEFGHIIDDCPRDPNIKTKLNPYLEHNRILKLTDFRKLYADTAVTTTFFLKKCVQVPKVYVQGIDDDDYDKQLVTESEAHRKAQENKGNIFKRGVMHFEDFNYKTYNKFILKDPTKSQSGYSDE